MVSRFRGCFVSGFLGFLVSILFVSRLLIFLVSWFLALLVSEFVGVLVSWFLSFLVPKFSGFVVPWFLGFLASEFQRFKDSKCHSIVWGEYLPGITEFPFHVFRKILIPYAGFPRTFETDFHDFWCPPFLKFSESWISIHRFIEIIY